MLNAAVNTYHVHYLCAATNSEAEVEVTAPSVMAAEQYARRQLKPEDEIIFVDEVVNKTTSAYPLTGFTQEEMDRLRHKITEEYNSGFDSFPD